MHPTAIRLLTAPWIVPGEGPAVRDGAVVVRGAEIVDVGRAVDILPRHAGPPVERCEGVLVPGLVNAHTHLELTGLIGIARGLGFVRWLEEMLRLRAAEPPGGAQRAARLGVAALQEAGTVAVGEITNTLAAADTLASVGISGIVFLELFGMDRARALEAAQRVARDLEHRPATGDLVFSPAAHTLYTTHPDAVRALLATARERGTRTSIHLAEHADERTFLESRGGPYADFARDRCFDSADHPCFGKGPIDVADDLGMLAPDVMLVHLTDARPDELGRIARRGSPVVVCPRSSLYIEGRLPPVEAMLEAGIVPALGTDSLASNDSLDVLHEAQQIARRLPGVKAQTLFEMATSAGARALGLLHLGRIAKGTRPGLLLFEGDAAEDPYGYVMRAPARRRIA